MSGEENKKEENEEKKKIEIGLCFAQPLHFRRTYRYRPSWWLPEYWYPQLRNSGIGQMVSHTETTEFLWMRYVKKKKRKKRKWNETSAAGSRFAPSIIT